MLVRLIVFDVVVFNLDVIWWKLSFGYFGWIVFLCLNDMRGVGLLSLIACFFYFVCLLVDVTRHVCLLICFVIAYLVGGLVLLATS